MSIAIFDRDTFMHFLQYKLPFFNPKYFSLLLLQTGQTKKSPLYI